MNINWTTTILAAARHSPQALDFVKSQLYPTSVRFDGEKAAMGRALKTLSMIIDHRLPYEIRFQYTPDTVEFGHVLDMFTLVCPNWRISPHCDFYYDGGIPNRDVLIKQTTVKLTAGGFPYQKLITYVNKSAAAMIQLYDIPFLTVDDYSDIMEKYGE